MSQTNQKPSKKPAPLILGSTSPYRLALLQRLRLPVLAAAPDFDERVLSRVSSASEVEELVLFNARGKLASLREQFPRHLILTSDQVGECEGRILVKALTVEAAVDQLAAMSGREHRLYTSVVLAHSESGEVRESVVVNKLRMRALSREQLRRYVELEQPLDAAGSYYSESLGIALFETIGGDDPTAIIGLPLITVTSMLGEFSRFPLDRSP